MGRKRRRNKKRRPRDATRTAGGPQAPSRASSPLGGVSHRPLRLRWGLFILIPLAVFAAGSDLAVYSRMHEDFIRYHHVHVPVNLMLMAATLTTLFVYTAYQVVCGVREGRKSA